MKLNKIWNMNNCTIKCNICSQTTRLVNLARQAISYEANTKNSAMLSTNTTTCSSNRANSTASPTQTAPLSSPFGTSSTTKPRHVPIGCNIPKIPHTPSSTALTPLYKTTSSHSTAPFANKTLLPNSSPRPSSPGGTEYTLDSAPRTATWANTSTATRTSAQ